MYRITLLIISLLRLKHKKKKVIIHKNTINLNAQIRLQISKQPQKYIQGSLFGILLAAGALLVTVVSVFDWVNSEPISLPPGTSEPISPPPGTSETSNILGDKDAELIKARAEHEKKQKLLNKEIVSWGYVKSRAELNQKQEEVINLQKRYISGVNEFEKKVQKNSPIQVTEFENIIQFLNQLENKIKEKEQEISNLKTKIREDEESKMMHEKEQNQNSTDEYKRQVKESKRLKDQENERMRNRRRRPGFDEGL